MPCDSLASASQSYTLHRLFQRSLASGQGAFFVVGYPFAAAFNAVHVVDLHNLVPDQFDIAAFSALVVALQRPQTVIYCLQARAFGRRAGDDGDFRRAARSVVPLEARFSALDRRAERPGSSLAAAPGKADV